MAMETRDYTVVSEGLNDSGRYIGIRCPFCTRRVVAYVWSLAGSGKRCECGAKFGWRFRSASREVED